MEEFIQEATKALQGVQEGDAKQITKAAETLSKLSQDQREEIINKLDNEGLSYLHHAVEKGNREFIKLLIDNGANLDIQDQKGDTPLLSAVRLGAFITEHNSNIGWRYFEDLSRIDDKELSTRLKLYKDSVDLLLNGGANPTIQNNSGKSAINIIEEVQKNYDNKIKELAKEINNVKYYDPENKTSIISKQQDKCEITKSNLDLISKKLLEKEQAIRAEIFKNIDEAIEKIDTRLKASEEERKKRGFQAIVTSIVKGALNFLGLRKPSNKEQALATVKASIDVISNSIKENNDQSYNRIANSRQGIENCLKNSAFVEVYLKGNVTPINNLVGELNKIPQSRNVVQQSYEM